MFQENNTQLAEKLAHLLADTVTAKSIFHGYHWNVIGPDFAQFHDFFALIYQDIEDSIDPLGENILKVGFPAPYLISDFSEMSCIKEDRLDGSSTLFLLQSGKRVNDVMLHCLFEAFAEAERSNEQGLMDFLATRIDQHKKWNWQIKAFLGVR